MSKWRLFSLLEFSWSLAGGCEGAGGRAALQEQPQRWLLSDWPTALGFMIITPLLVLFCPLIKENSGFFSCLLLKWKVLLKRIFLRIYRHKGVVLPSLAGRNVPSTEFTTLSDLIGRKTTILLRDCHLISFVMDFLWLPLHENYSISSLLWFKCS